MFPGIRCVLPHGHDGAHDSQPREDGVLPAVAIADLLVPGFSIDAFERKLIETALVKAQGNKTAAARLLGITRRRLYSRLDSLAGKRAREP